MRRLVVVALLGLFTIPSFANAQDLALKRVMLSSAGLGYFEYEATVENDATLKLTVPLDQVDDVLKSFVVYDDKGGIGGLSLPGKEPLKQAFKDLPFDENALISAEGLLTALKGARVTVSGSRSLSGRMVSLQPETSTSKDGTTLGVRNRVTLLTDNGLQQFVIEDMESLQFDDPAIRAKVAKALAAIEANRATDARTLELTTKGQGKRAVRVAYRVSVPVWKASYRMTLPGDAAASKAALQGWATIENMSGQDWKGVELTLSSGRPVAFHQALYEAYYVTRPEIPVEVAGRLMPSVDRGGVGAKAAVAPPPPPAPAAPAPMQRMRAADATGAAPPAAAAAAEQLEATDTATQVTFRFPRPVDLGNGRTLSLPILDRQVPAERLALYEAYSAARNPLAAIRLTNDGDTGLPPGILTLYERDKSGNVSYVGDARLSAFPTGETRLLPYALDEKIMIERESAQSQRIANGSVVNGALRTSLIVRQSTSYRVKGALTEPRKLIVIQSHLAGWTLVKPDAKGIEISEGNYRIPFQLAPGGDTQLLEVAQEQTRQQEFRLLDGSAEQLGVYAHATEFDGKTRDALTRVLQLQKGVAEAQRTLEQVDTERKQIVDEQARIRENIGKVPAGSDLQKRYLATLDKQENELDTLAKKRVDAQKAVDAAREALRTYIAQLG